MKYSRGLTLLMFLFFFCATTVTATDNEVARVKILNGTASIVRNNVVMEVQNDSKIFEKDVLKTGVGGSLGIIFKDDTILSLGPKSEMVIDEFLFVPTKGNLSIITRLLKGTAAYISGIIAKLSPQSVRFETPVATVGVRGTRFLVHIDEVGPQ